MRTDVDQFLDDPESYLRNFKAPVDVLARKLNERLYHLTMEDLPGAVQACDALRYLASSVDHPCCTTLSLRFEAACQKRLEHFEEAYATIQKAITLSNCSYCVAELRAREAQLYLAMGDNAAATRVSSHSLLEFTGLGIDSLLRSRRNDHFSEVIRAAIAAPLMFTGRAVFNVHGDHESAMRAFRAADRATAIPASSPTRQGRSDTMLRYYRWWDRMQVPCPGLPTASIRESYNEAAFINYVLVLEDSSNPADRAEARKHTEVLKRRKGMTKDRKSRVHWLSGALKVDSCMTEKGSKRWNLQVSSMRDFRKAQKLLLEIGQVENLVACICDAARLPWIKDAGKTARDMLSELGDRSDPIESALKERDPSLFDSWQEALHASGDPAIKKFEQIRDRSGANFPSFLPNKVA